MYSYSPIQGTRSRFVLKVWDRFFPLFSNFFGPCPLDLRITIHSHVVMVFFQQSLHILLCLKIARTTVQCMLVLQSGGQNFILVEFKWNQDLRVEHKHIYIVLFIFLSTKMSLTRHAHTSWQVIKCPVLQTSPSVPTPQRAPTSSCLTRLSSALTHLSTLCRNFRTSFAKRRFWIQDVFKVFTFFLVSVSQL